MDGSNRLGLLKLLAPKLPGIFTAAASHSFGFSQTSSKWDLRTAVIMATLQMFMNPAKPSPVGRIQRLSLIDPGIKGPLWISKQTIPASAESAADVLQQLTTAIDSMCGEGVVKAYTLPEIRPVEVEWTGARAGVGSSETRLDLDEKDHFARLMAETSSDVTTLFIHGGALYLMDPATHRVTVTRLAKHTGGRCVSVRYRLAPQNPFPAALLDCFVAYLSLLCPPPGSIHEAVPAKKIVFAGDSAGGTLSLALVQLILQLHRQSGGQVPKVSFHGQEVPVPLPAGLALMSPWVDLTRCLPSIHQNALYDYIPPPRADGNRALEPDAVWPTDPPRGDLYCEDAMLLHPLVSPITAQDWTGAPPVFVCMGQEALSDEIMVVSRHLASDGVKTEFWHFDAMPHVFPAVLTHLPGSAYAMERWAAAITRMAEGRATETSGTWVEAKTMSEKKLDVARLASQLTDADVKRRMKDAQAKISLSPKTDDTVLAKL